MTQLPPQDVTINNTLVDIAIVITVLLLIVTACLFVNGYIKSQANVVRCSDGLCYTNNGLVCEDMGLFSPVGSCRPIPTITSSPTRCIEVCRVNISEMQECPKRHTQILCGADIP